MLEQLKEIILEMELLLQDCCHPVLSKGESNSCDEFSFNNLPNRKPIVSQKYSSHENFIRIDPCLRKVFSSFPCGDPCEEECTIEERKLRKGPRFYRTVTVKFVQNKIIPK